LVSIKQFTCTKLKIIRSSILDSDRPQVKPRIIKKSNRKYDEEKAGNHRSPKKSKKKKAIERDVDEVLSFSSEPSEDIRRFAMDNKAYVDDETVNAIPLSNRRTRKSPQAHSSSLFTSNSRNKYMSSDSETEMAAGSKTEILMADVHFNSDRQQQSSSKWKSNRGDAFSTTTWVNWVEQLFSFL